MPVVTVDTTEDTQTFQTDQDEAREVRMRGAAGGNIFTDLRIFSGGGWRGAAAVIKTLQVCLHSTPYPLYTVSVLSVFSWPSPVSAMSPVSSPSPLLSCWRVAQWRPSRGAAARPARHQRSHFYSRPADQWRLGGRRIILCLLL